MSLVHFSDFLAAIATMTPQTVGPHERACLRRLLDPHRTDFVTPHQFEALLKPCGPLTEMPLKVKELCNLPYFYAFLHPSGVRKILWNAPAGNFILRMADARCDNLFVDIVRTTNKKIDSIAVMFEGNGK